MDQTTGTNNPWITVVLSFSCCWALQLGLQCHCTHETGTPFMVLDGTQMSLWYRYPAVHYNMHMHAHCSCICAHMCGLIIATCWCDYIHTSCVQCSCIPPVHCLTCADKVQSACCCLMSTLQCVLAKWCKCTSHIHSYTLMHTHALVQIPELCCGFSFSLPSFSCCNCENSTFLCLVPGLGLSCWGEVVGYVHVLTCRLLITEVFLSHHLLRVMLRPNELSGISVCWL